MLAGDPRDGVGKVAEKSATCFSFGVWRRISSTSSRKPMRSISSASSRTTAFSTDRSRVLRRRWSRMRPGVPTTACTPLAQMAQLHVDMLWPP